MVSPLVVRTVVRSGPMDRLVCCQQPAACRFEAVVDEFTRGYHPLDTRSAEHIQSAMFIESVPVVDRRTGYPSVRIALVGLLDELRHPPTEPVTPPIERPYVLCAGLPMEPRPVGATRANESDTSSVACWPPTGVTGRRGRFRPMSTQLRLRRRVRIALRADPAAGTGRRSAQQLGGRCG